MRYIFNSTGTFLRLLAYAIMHISKLETLPRGVAVDNGMCNDSRDKNVVGAINSSLGAYNIFV